jgi:RNA polymerase sigma-70 factor (ECF subfamily)
MFTRQLVSRRRGFPIRFGLTLLAALSISALAPAGWADDATPTSSVDERLDRLEKLVRELTEEVRSLRKNQDAGDPPTVVRTVPGTGATDVDPSLKEIKVTFDRKMQNGSWSWTNRSEDTFPKVTGKIRYEKDKCTCVLPVELEAGKTYWIGVNSQRFRNFKDQAGNPATPFELTFTTKK